MKWLEMANMLFEKSNGLSPRGAHVHLDTAGWIRTWTPYQNHNADRAARHFAKNLEWPLMEAEPAYQLYFRCLLAIENCMRFDEQGPPPPDGFEAEQKKLEFLLVDCWHQNGLEWAARRYPTRTSRAVWNCA